MFPRSSFRHAAPFVLNIAFLGLSFLALSCDGPAGPPGDGFGSLDDPSVMPAVVYTYPPMNSVGPYPDFYVVDCGSGSCPYYSLIQLRFNKFMDVSSVRRAVHIASSKGGITTDTGKVVSYGGDVVLVTPVDTAGGWYQIRYEVGEVYTLSVDTTARDVNGNRLQAPFSMTFVPEPSFRVSGISPADGSVDVTPGTSVRLDFNSDVDSAIIPHIRVTPPVDLTVNLSYYPSGSLYVNFPNGLANLTTYTMRVDSGATDAGGHPLVNGYSAGFTTAGFGVLYSYPGDGTTGVQLYTTLNITFNSQIDTASLRGAFSIDPPVEGAYYVGSYSNEAMVLFTPARGWGERTTYTVRLDTSLRSKGGTPLSSPWTSTFRTTRFGVTIEYPWEGGTDISRFPYMRASANAPLDTSTVRSALSLDPPVPLNVQFDWDARRFTAVPASLLSPSTEYTFTVDTTLATVGGVRLSKPVSVTFRTAPLE